MQILENKLITILQPLTYNTSELYRSQKNSKSTRSPTGHATAVRCLYCGPFSLLLLVLPPPSVPPTPASSIPWPLQAEAAWKPRLSFNGLWWKPLLPALGVSAREDAELHSVWNKAAFDAVVTDRSLWIHPCHESNTVLA